MSMIHFLFFIFAAKSTFAFVDPHSIRCNSSTPFSVQMNGQEKKYSAGKYELPLRDVKVLTVYSAAKKSADDKKIAKLYPISGIDSVLLDKTYKVSTDARTFWVLSNSAGKEQIHCELLSE